MNRKSYILLGLAVLLCIGEACAEKPHPVNAPTQSIKEVQQKKENPQNPKKGNQGYKHPHAPKIPYINRWLKKLKLVHRKRHLPKLP